jgi:hypothetical protein
MEHETRRLVQDLFFSFVGPCAFYLVANGWAKVCGAFTDENRRIVLTSTLLFILFCLALTGFAERSTLGAFWNEQPILVSVGFLVTGVTVLGLVKLILCVWRSRGA